MVDGIGTMERLRREGQAGFRDFRLRIELTGITPSIWRRIVVADSVSLPLLHRILQAAFGWEDRHLHQFCVGSVCFGVPDGELETILINERGIRLNQLLKRPGDRLQYEYDFGDGWDHEVVLEEMTASDEAVAIAQCLGGERAGPLEDSGGPAAYRELVSALCDADHPQHQDMKRWAGAYNPSACDLDQINRSLARLPKVRRRTPAT